MTATFGDVENITITIQGTGTLALSGNGYLLRIGAGQTVIVKDITLQGRDNTVPRMAGRYQATLSAPIIMSTPTE